MRGLRDKVAIVTGGTATMGEAIAQRLGEEGVRVVAASRRSSLGEAVADRLRLRGIVASFVTCDVTVEDDARRVVDYAVTEHGRLDILVNNAAPVDLIRSGRERPVAEEDNESFDRMMRVCVYGPFFLAKQAIPRMIDAGGGSIINISSAAAVTAQPAMTGYGPAKAALTALARQIAVDYGIHHIRANTVVAGSIRVAENQSLHDDPDRGSALRANQMLKQVGHPDDIASAVAFLASDDAAFITGLALPVDGGASARKPSPDISSAYAAQPHRPRT
jgi:NAD(P)-dependent dehydrogenase (short-subunit alcohol dehydrogenase family)